MGIDPTVHYCKCGCSWRPGTFHKLVMLVRGEYVHECPQCHTRMKFKLIYHVVKVETMEVKNRKELWKNG